MLVLSQGTKLSKKEKFLDQLNPLMTQSKNNSLSKHIIMDLSFPLGASVNAGIEKGFYQGIPFSFMLPSVTMLIDRLVHSGSTAFLWCADLSRAYWQLRVCSCLCPFWLGL